MRYFIITLLAAMLVGCITMPQTVDIGGVNGPLAAQAVDGKIALPIDPTAFLGVRSTPDIESGNFTVVYARFPIGPDGMLAEFDARRVTSPAFAVGPDGREYPAQALFWGFATCEPTLAVIIEGTRNLKGFSAVLSNTTRDQFYDLHGRSISVDVARFHAINTRNGDFRRQIIAKSGSRLDNFQVVTRFDEVIHEWKLYDTAKHIGRIRSPYPLEIIQGVARINPQHSHSEKFLATTSGAVSPLTLKMSVANVVMEYLIASNTPAMGWTIDSMVSRKDQALNIWAWDRLRTQSLPDCLPEPTRRMK